MSEAPTPLKPRRRRPGSEDVEDLMPLEAATPVSRPARRSRLEDTIAEVNLNTSKNKLHKRQSINLGTFEAYSSLTESESAAIVCSFLPWSLLGLGSLLKVTYLNRDAYGHSISQ